MVRGLPSDENEDHITRNFEAYGTMGTLPCQVKKVCLAYRSSDYEEMEKKVLQYDPHRNPPDLETAELHYVDYM